MEKLKLKATAEASAILLGFFVFGILVSFLLDEATAQAVLWFQDRAGLPQTGDIDKKTWAHLAHEYRQIVGDGTGTFPIRTAQDPQNDTPRQPTPQE